MPTGWRLVVTGVVLVAGIATFVLVGDASRRHPVERAAPIAARTARRRTAVHSRVPRVRRRPSAVGLRVVRLVDQGRDVRLSDGRIVSRTLVTEVRYPALGRPADRAVRDTRPARAAGPF